MGPRPCIGRLPDMLWSHLQLALSNLAGGDDVLQEIRLSPDGISRLGILKGSRRQDEVSLGPMLDLR